MRCLTTLRGIFSSNGAFENELLIGVQKSKTPEKQLNEVQIHNLPEKEIRLMIVKMIQDLWKTMEKMQEMFMKDLLLLLLLLSHFSCVRLCGSGCSSLTSVWLALSYSLGLYSKDTSFEVMPSWPNSQDPLPLYHNTSYPRYIFFFSTYHYLINDI